MTKEELQSILDEHVGLITVKEQEGVLAVCKVEVGQTVVFSDEKGESVNKLRLSIEKTDEKLLYTPKK